MRNGIVLCAALSGCSLVTSLDGLSGQASDAGAPPSSDGGSRDVAAEGGSAPCADVTRDPANCGACGHDCLGGECVDGVCQPFIFAAAEARPSSLVQDDSDLFWSSTTTNLIRRKSKAGGDAANVVSGTYATTLALGPELVYFVDLTSNVMSAPKAGGATTSLFKTSSARGLAVTPSRIFVWTSTQLLGAPLAGGTPTPLATVESRAGLVVADGFVYFDDASTGRLLRLPVTAGSGATASIVVEGQAGTNSLAYAAGKLVWTNGAEGAVRFADVSAVPATAQTLAAAQPSPTSVATDGVDIYWVTSYESIVGCKMTDCSSPRVVAKDQAAAVDLLISGQALFWVDSSRGAVMKVAR